MQVSTEFFVAFLFSVQCWVYCGPFRKGGKTKSTEETFTKHDLGKCNTDKLEICNNATSCFTSVAESFSLWVMCFVDKKTWKFQSLYFLIQESGLVHSLSLSLLLCVWVCVSMYVSGIFINIIFKENYLSVLYTTGSGIFPLGKEFLKLRL